MPPADSPPGGLTGLAPALQPAARGGISRLWIGIAIALAVLCGVGLLGSTALGGIFVMFRPTATLTPSPTPTQTQTPTPLPPPTATQPPPTPAVVTLFEDDFSSAANGWDETSTANSSWSLAGGEYVLGVSIANYYIWGNPDGANLTLSNVHIEVTARNTGTAVEPGFGILCGYQNGDNLYYMGMSPDGYYIIVKTVNGDDIVLSDETSWLQSSAIPLNAASYRIGADCGNGALTLTVNGNRVATVNDSSFSQGTIGLFARTFDQTPAEIRFDDLVVTSLEP